MKYKCHIKEITLIFDVDKIEKEKIYKLKRNQI